MQTQPDTLMQPYGDNFILVLPATYQEHTNAHPFCYNETCPCHHEQNALAQVQDYVAQALMTSEEAVLFVNGKTV